MSLGTIPACFPALSQYNSAAPGDQAQEIQSWLRLYVYIYVNVESVFTWRKILYFRYAHAYAYVASENQALMPTVISLPH